MPKRSQDESILVDHEQGVTRICLNRVEKRNSLTPEMMGELADSLNTAMTSPLTRVIVLTNQGNTFCAGADLSAGSSPESANRPVVTFADLLSIIMDGPKPVVGLINGHAMGGGVGLAAACDISIMNSEAKLGFTEVRLGVAPSIISVVCLPKMSLADASELFLTGERVSAKRSVEAGLINRCCPPKDLDRELAITINQLLKGAPNALAAAKSLIRLVPTLSRDEGFEFTSNLSRRLFNTDEAKNGLAAFLNKQQPPWTL